MLNLKGNECDGKKASTFGVTSKWGDYKAYNDVRHILKRYFEVTSDFNGMPGTKVPGFKEAIKAVNELNLTIHDSLGKIVPVENLEIYDPRSQFPEEEIQVTVVFKNSKVYSEYFGETKK